MAGELVASFGDGGTLDLPLRPFSVFTQHDGRFIVTRNNSAATGPYIERFLPDGTPDASFNSELLGQIQARIGWMEKVTMDAADRLLISSGAGLARVTAGGRLDKTFGKNGVIHLAYRPRAIAVLDGGEIVTTGQINRGDDNLRFDDHVMTLLTPDGRIDTRFDADGTRVVFQAKYERPPGDEVVYQSGVEAEQIVSLPNGRVLYLHQVHVSGSQTDGFSRGIGGRAFRLADGSIDTAFTFDRTNVLTQESVDQFVAGEAVSRDGALVDSTRTMPDGSVQFFFAPSPGVTTETPVTHIATLTPDGTITNARAFADMLAAPIRDPQTGALNVSNGKSITRLTPAGVEEGTFTLALPEPTGSWSAMGFGSDGNVIASFLGSDIERGQLGKLHATDAPTGTFWGGPIRRARGAAYRFTVTWDDPDGIDVSTLASRTIVVDLPDLSTRTAVFESATPSTNADSVVATYHLRAPDGVWDAADNGRCQVRLRGKHVADTTGQRATGRVMGEFYVDIDPTPVTGFGAGREQVAAPQARPSVAITPVRQLLDEENDALA